jgi:hypothetical protein
MSSPHDHGRGNATSQYSLNGGAHSPPPGATSPARSPTHRPGSDKVVPIDIRDGHATAGVPRGSPHEVHPAALPKVVEAPPPRGGGAPAYPSGAATVAGGKVQSAPGSHSGAHSDHPIQQFIHHMFGGLHLLGHGHGRGVMDIHHQDSKTLVTRETAHPYE